ncbi:MAG: hypothetical protein Q7R48_03055 [bacterium]|nr:hypothetical protein [bacterium]
MMNISRMWRDLRSLHKRLRQERDRQEFAQFFGFPPGWTQITQKLVDKRLNQITWQTRLIRENEYFSYAWEGMEQHFRRAQEVAERCGYFVRPLGEHSEMVARKGRRRKSK